MNYPSWCCVPKKLLKPQVYRALFFLLSELTWWVSFSFFSFKNLKSTGPVRSTVKEVLLELPSCNLFKQG